MFDYVRKYLNTMACIIEQKGILAGSADHNTDIGTNRENGVRQFLEDHLPKRLCAVSGGTVFGINDVQSKQIDIIVYNDLALRFDANAKTFINVESVAAVVEVKSDLDEAMLTASLNNMASVPAMSDQAVKNFSLRPDKFKDFMREFPSGFVFSYTGIAADTLLDHAKTYFANNGVGSDPHKLARWPKAIIVNKRYQISLGRDGSGNPIPVLDKFGVGQEGLPLTAFLNFMSGYVSYLSGITLDPRPYLNGAYGLPVR